MKLAKRWRIRPLPVPPLPAPLCEFPPMLGVPGVDCWSAWLVCTDCVEWRDSRGEEGERVGEFDAPTLLSTLESSVLACVGSVE